MKYFFLRQDNHYTPPEIKDWFGKLDQNTMNNKKKYDFPKHMVFTIKENMQMEFLDIAMFPYLIVRQEVMETIRLFDPFISFLDIVLFSEKDKKSETYFVPFMPKVDCLLEERRETPGISAFKPAKVDKDKISGKAIVRVDKINNLRVLISLELAESLLRRKLSGIGLEEVECV